MIGMKGFTGGFTLVEAMVSLMIVLFVLVPLLLAFAGALLEIMIAREISLADDDVKDVFEKLKLTPFPNLPVEFPDGASINENIIGGYLLSDEDIVVSYPEGIGGNPLAIQVTVSWTSITGKARTETYKTIRTRML